ncbi:MAG: glyceraldehyde-3-phosphate dehydrogenase [Euryarchaeota archaeon RBG_16_68_12]|nr:MAG: glyceraldehyde-3-phosphate dehydrogenase [Euryarchaeota archaeon RBG_16_68_12]
MPARIAINGYGTIGKRVADAVSLQDDMEVVGVSKMSPNFEARLAVQKGYPLYATTNDVLPKFDKAGIKVHGTLEDLLKQADLVVDATPEESGFKPAYEKAGVKAIWQGGEEHSLTNLSFNAAANYADCLGARFVRVPSCNTTGLIRTLYPLDVHFGIERVLAVMVRRATDPGDSKKGPINAIEPELEMPSHHGPDVQTVLPKLNIHTIAVKVPTTIMHLHAVSAQLRKQATDKDVLDTWARTPRVKFVKGGEGVKSTAQIMELARDLGRPRSDLYEIAVWSDGVHVVDGNQLYYFQAVHQESDVVPENVDAIRAMMGIEKDGRKSIEKTDRSMGIDK